MENRNGPFTFEWGVIVGVVITALVGYLWMTQNCFGNYCIIALR